jgi:hypothetical protein
LPARKETLTATVSPKFRKNTVQADKLGIDGGSVGMACIVEAVRFFRQIVIAARQSEQAQRDNCYYHIIFHCN